MSKLLCFPSPSSNLFSLCLILNNRKSSFLVLARETYTDLVVLHSPPNRLSSFRLLAWIVLPQGRNHRRVGREKQARGGVYFSDLEHLLRPLTLCTRLFWNTAPRWSSSG
ncbi:unnamed protein product [Linum tenue]|uniref:Uncharacterized protein n=1 Tax=Linum tenue TaxID=586396 RepID=A0AAV0NDQ3_9ROSI|nr:unnamed protein product [Linum tenue]